VLGTAGLFPDHLNLAFNERVRNHLRHLPDPAVRPGAMNYLSNAMSVGALPDAGEYTWLDELVPLEPGASRSGSAPSTGAPTASPSSAWGSTGANRASAARSGPPPPPW
jgi:hypothetical protein